MRLDVERILPGQLLVDDRQQARVDRRADPDEALVGVDLEVPGRRRRGTVIRPPGSQAGSSEPASLTVLSETRRTSRDPQPWTRRRRLERLPDAARLEATRAGRRRRSRRPWPGVRRQGAVDLGIGRPEHAVGDRSRPRSATRSTGGAAFRSVAKSRPRACACTAAYRPAVRDDEHRLARVLASDAADRLEHPYGPSRRTSPRLPSPGRCASSARRVRVREALLHLVLREPGPRADVDLAQLAHAA